MCELGRRGGRKARARDKGVDDVLAQDEELRAVAREVLLKTMRDPNAKQSDRLAVARALYSYGPTKRRPHRAQRTSRVAAYRGTTPGRSGVSAGKQPKAERTARSRRRCS
jgi:hypothetical protein